MELAEKLTKEIYDKYPIIWGKIYNKFESKQYDDFYIIFQDHLIYFYHEIYDDYNKCGKMLIPFSMLYGLLEEYFRKEHKIYFFSKLLTIAIDLKENKMENDLEFERNFDKFQYETIIKACEILDKEL